MGNEAKGVRKNFSGQTEMGLDHVYLREFELKKVSVIFNDQLWKKKRGYKFSRTPVSADSVFTVSDICCLLLPVNNS